MYFPIAPTNLNLANQSNGHTLKLGTLFPGAFVAMCCPYWQPFKLEI